MEKTYIYGAGRLHHCYSALERQRILAKVLEAGFRAFDVAPAYGNGVNEKEIGIALRGSREQFEINTKFGIPITEYGSWARHFFPGRRLIDIATGSSRRAYQKRIFSAAAIEQSVERSLRALKTDYIDTLFIHEPISQIPTDLALEIIETTESLKKKGKIRSLGIAGPTDSIAKFPMLGSIDVFQMPLIDFLSAGRSWDNKQLILYGIFQAYSADDRTQTFCQFVRAALAKRGSTRAIVTSMTPTVISTFSALTNGIVES